MSEDNLIRMYRCDVCNKVGKWSTDWQYYSSIVLEENYGDNGRVYTCSDDCRNKINPENQLRKKLRVSPITAQKDAKRAVSTN